MNDQLIRDLLHEVADDMEPADRLDAIRAATAPAGRRTRRGWWVAGGAGLVAASVVTALAVTTGGAPQTREPDPVGPASTAGTTATDGGTKTDPVAVYFVGDTASGPRLFSELRPEIDADSRVLLAIHAALGGDALDPDYRSPWPEGVVLRQWSDRPDGITVTLEGAPVKRPAGLSEEDARLALEQLVRTAQSVSGRGKVPVDVQIEQQVTDTILGVPTTAPLTGSPDRDVLAPVSLSEPFEGQVVDKDEKVLYVSGQGITSNNRLRITIDRVDGTDSAGDGTIKGVLRPDRHTTFGPAGFGLAGVDPGEYVVVAAVRSADGTTETDTRRITIVD
ncbi:GerMN domain-containing protein [Nocardioides sp. STR2]|uniref:GerMN domain-containing protein n=1 Tax=Nocardioides pini TaxID=2975053 RepID=A0ABT4CD76_9ACTN|nr:GerMN domain-containing protein [Nocardioides pini]MCY4725832.1 GerMN domain-containing protein [Nocardioides pini]